jgi:hypothetical protein
LYSEIPHQRQGCFLKRSRAFKKRTGAFSKTTGCFDVFPLVLYNMAKHLVFLSEVSASPQTSCSSAFRLKDIHDKILQPKKIFQRDRVSDVVLVGFLSVFGFTFIHLLTTAERKNYAVEGSRCINLSAGMPMNRTFAERLKLLKDFWGHSSREGYFSSKDGYAYQKEGGKTLKTCRKMSQFL